MRALYLISTCLNVLFLFPFGISLALNLIVLKENPQKLRIRPLRLLYSV